MMSQLGFRESVCQIDQREFLQVERWVWRHRYTIHGVDIFPQSFIFLEHKEFVIQGRERMTENEAGGVHGPDK